MVVQGLNNTDQTRCEYPIHHQLTSIGHRFVGELDADLMDTGDLPDVGTLGSHDRAVILLGDDTLHRHLGILCEAKDRERERSCAVKKACALAKQILWAINYLSEAGQVQT